MVREKKVVDGKEVEMETEKQGNEISASSEAVNTDVKDENLVDEKGVSFKNRLAEATRKIEDNLRKEFGDKLTLDREAIKQEVISSLQQQQQQTDEPAWYQTSRALAQDIVRQERMADKTVKSELDKLQVKYPLIEAYRSDIETELAGYPAQLRGQPIAISKVALEHIGAHSNEFARKEKENKDSEINNVLDSTPKPTTTTEIVFTPEEQAFESQHDFLAKGFTHKEVREKYNKRFNKDKK